jgi:hypothetical protein
MLSPVRTEFRIPLRRPPATGILGAAYVPGAQSSNGSSAIATMSGWGAAGNRIAALERRTALGEDETAFDEPVRQGPGDAIPYSV